MTSVNSKLNYEKVTSEVHVLGPFMGLLAENGSEMHNNINQTKFVSCTMAVTLRAEPPSIFRSTSTTFLSEKSLGEERGLLSQTAAVNRT